MEILAGTVFSLGHPSPFFSFLRVVSKLKRQGFCKRHLHSSVQVTIHEENGGFASLSFAVVISFPHDIQIQPLK